MGHHRCTGGKFGCANNRIALADCSKLEYVCALLVLLFVPMHAHYLYSWASLLWSYDFMILWSSLSNELVNQASTPHVAKCHRRANIWEHKRSTRMKADIWEHNKEHTYESTHMKAHILSTHMKAQRRAYISEHSGVHIWACAAAKQRDKSQEPFCVEIYRKNARPQAKRAILCGNVLEKCRTRIPRPAFYFRKNTHGDATRAILCGNLQEKCRIPRWPPGSNIGPFILTVRNLSVWPRCLGKHVVMIQIRSQAWRTKKTWSVIKGQKQWREIFQKSQLRQSETLFLLNLEDAH